MTSDSLPNEQVSIDLAKVFFRDIKEQLSQIYAVATTAKRAEESLGEERMNGNTAAIFGVIEMIAEDFSSIYRVEEYLEVASKGVTHER